MFGTRLFLVLQFRGKPGESIILERRTIWTESAGSGTGLRSGERFAGRSGVRLPGPSPSSFLGDCSSRRRTGRRKALPAGTGGRAAPGSDSAGPPRFVAPEPAAENGHATGTGLGPGAASESYSCGDRRGVKSHRGRRKMKMYRFLGSTTA